MSRAISGGSLEDIAERIRMFGLKSLQLNLRSAGLETLPSALDERMAEQIGDVFRSRGLEVAAVSGTFNTAHPDPEIRAENIRRFGVLSSRCRALGTHIVTLCTGTRDRQDMWQPHPENSDPSALRDFLETLRRLLRFADQHDIVLAFEPETANIIDTSIKGRHLIEEFGSTRVRVVLDPANLLRINDLPDTRHVLDDAFTHLGPYIALAHAKDIVAEDGECRHVSPGAGVLDFRYYLKLLRSAGYDGALILHDLEESEIATCKSRFQELLEQTG